MSTHAHHTRRRFAVGLALALGATILVSSPVTAKTATSKVPVLSWRPCEDGFECATASVPLDYDYPAGPTISLPPQKHTPSSYPTRLAKTTGTFRNVACVRVIRPVE